MCSACIHFEYALTHIPKYFTLPKLPNTPCEFSRYLLRSAKGHLGTDKGTLRAVDTEDLVVLSGSWLMGVDGFEDGWTDVP